ncbi:src-like-adapter 2 isoform X1 [Meleagris gallopavo]|uniref:Src-like-adapter 2 n=2 Tax=Meleagris gallopavo TaxID=9103 RepID=G1MRQ5_MELGA|nr:src-like-adapter 2 isoform X1 [Meleagris gallopavo]
MRAPRCVWLLVPAPLPLPRTRPGTCRTEPRPSLPAGGIHGRGSGLRADPAVRRGMGILPSREKPLSAAPLAAVPAPSPLPTQAAPGGFQELALGEFPSGAGATAVLRMGEQLRVLSEDGEWWLVASQVSGKECLIPSSCVAKVRHRWLYEGVSREKAEELLLQPGNHSGAFLIRESQTRRGGFSLSVRRTELASWDAVTHYRIHRLENGWLYISPRLTFPSLHDLVDHYSECGEGLCCTLREPCVMEVAKAAPALVRPAVVKKPTLNWDKIDSSVLLSEAVPPLGEGEEDSPISLGLREAISSYLLLTDGVAPETGPAGKGVKSS